MRRRSFLITGGTVAASTALPLLTAGPTAWAQVSDPKSKSTVLFDGPVVAVKNVQLVDGTGRRPRKAMTLIAEKGRITTIGPTAQTTIPSGATIVDGTGKTLLPGFVMMHEHVFYPTGYGRFPQKTMNANYTEMLATFPPLYLAGGTTTMRTAGTLNPDGDLNLSADIAQGGILGPDVHVTGPYINGPGLPILKLPRLTSPQEAARLVDYWAKAGIRSFKAYLTIDKEMLRAAVRMAHRHGATVTGHLGKVTYREAALIGIDNLEHGFAVASDFLPQKKVGVAPAHGETERALSQTDPDSPEVRKLIELLVSKRIALTSTLAVFERVTPKTPQIPDAALAVLAPELRRQYLDSWESVQQGDSVWTEAFPREMRMERLFVQAGGTLMAGTDPTGIGGVVPGFASKRQIQLMVQMGLSFEHAIQCSTLEGARFLRRHKDIGSLEVGKRADFALVDGDPIQDPNALERMPLVAKAGIGYDTEMIFSALADSVGLN